MVTTGAVAGFDWEEKACPSAQLSDFMSAGAPLLSASACLASLGDITVTMVTLELPFSGDE